MSIQPAQLRSSHRTGIGLFAVLLLAMAVAMVLWAQNAKAVLPTTDTSASSQPSADGLAPGSPVTYTFNGTPKPAGTGLGYIMSATIDGDLSNVFVNCNTANNVTGSWSFSSNVAKCQWDNVGNNTNLTFTMTVSGTIAGSLAKPSNFAFCEDTTSNGSCDSTKSSLDTNTQRDYFLKEGELVSLPGGDSDTNPIGIQHEVIFHVQPGVTCQSDPDLTDNVRVCDESDVHFDSPDIATPNGFVSNTALNQPADIHVLINSGTTGVYRTWLTLVKDLQSCQDCANSDSTDFDSIAFVKTYVEGFIEHQGTDNQDVVNNVIGARHYVCVVDQNGDPLALPHLDAIKDVNVTAGGGYQNVNDPDPTYTDPVVVLADNDHCGGGTSISWISTQAGDQEITAQYLGDDNVLYPLRFDGGTGNHALVKEWNVLERSLIVINGTSYATDTAGVAVTDPTAVVSADTFAKTVTIQAGVVPAVNGGYDLVSPVNIQDHFWGSHLDRTGTKHDQALTGVEFTTTKSGCGDVTGTLNGTTVEDMGNSDTFPNMDVTVDGSPDCGPGSSMTVTICGSEPGPLGSGVGVEVCQTIIINFVYTPPQKQVFLAWAGQRIVVEHDWRSAPGDQTDGTPNGSSCAFSSNSDETTGIAFIKQNGPGNFVSGLDATIVDGDYAIVEGGKWDGNTSQEGDVPNDPTGSCIARALFESEDQGEVDIESFRVFEQNGDFVPTVDQTKVAIVVYYMKLNTVTTSLVSEVSKPTHNASDNSGSGVDGVTDIADYAPGNPWDASKDDADNKVSWNVSTDLLVRVRVTGWFLTSDPSGREADTSNPLNILPANRWVMPNDWAILAGGPADPADGTDATGTAETFRPWYDTLFAPNNTACIALVSPDGDLGVQTDCTPTVTNVGIPFEGPYSLIDIPGLYDAGKGGAALSNIKTFLDGSPNTSVVRDADFGDGDVDMWDAPMPPARVVVSLRGTGFLKQVYKEDVYYTGTANDTGAQLFPNPFYVANIPDSAFIPAATFGGGYNWDSWGNDGPQADGGFAASSGNGSGGQGPYHFWEPVVTPGTNPETGLVLDPLLATAAKATELAAIATAYGDSSISRDLTVYTDNHGEAMVTANGDFNTDLTACATNQLAGGKQCKPGDAVGTGTITATADYPDFRGKHAPVLSNAASVTWTWGGYKDVTVENDPAGNTQFKYIVFHALDRDGFCLVPSGSVSLHPVLTSDVNDTFNGNPSETVDFLIDSGEGIILDSSNVGTVNDGKQFATGVTTYSTTDATYLGLKFGLSPLAAAGATDECQAWIKVSNSLLGELNVLATAHDDEGDVGFDRIVDLQNTSSLTLNFRWSLVTWPGADNIAVADALKGTGANDAGNDIFSEVTAVYGWDAAAQDWLGFFPDGVNVPGANDLTSLHLGSAYWIAIKGPGAVTWTIATNVGA